MGFPSVAVKVAFASNPFDSSYTWTDITSFVDIGQAPIVIRRGRQYERDQVEPGTLSLVLDNRDRRFDPTNTASPYAPNVIPNRPIAVTATWNTTEYPLFLGYVDAWTPTYDNRITETARVMVKATDAMKLFNLTRFTSTITSARTDIFLGLILNTIGWPPMRALHITGTQSTIIQQSFVDTTAMDAIRSVVETEDGIFFIAPDGYATLHGRLFRSVLKVASSGTFGDSAPELPYQAIEPSYDDMHIWNDIRVTRVGGTTQLAFDNTSISKFRQRTLTRTGLLIATDNEAADAAAWYLDRYKAPRYRFDRLEVEGGASDALWPLMLGLDISDRITIRRRPPGGGTIELDCYIEAVEHRIEADRGSWTTAWQLSPASVEHYLRLDDTLLGTLDSNSLAY